MLETITLNDIISFLGILAGVIGSITTITVTVNKIISKKINSEIVTALTPINNTLNEIKEQNDELKTQGQDTRKEIILIMKINQAMTTELKELGHLNGETTAALQDLNDYLINK